MIELSKEQTIQEQIYKFPYHYIPKFYNGNFSEVLTLGWGYEYISYIAFVLEQLKSIEFQSLLDVGCGDGKLLYETQQAFKDKELIGVDFSETAIRLAQAMSPSVEYVYGDITDETFLNKKYDVVTLVETLEHIPPVEIENFLQGVHYYLEDNGLLIITVPSKNVKLNPKHYQHFNLDSLSESVKPFFKIRDYYYINKISFKTRWVERILANRFFILNNQPMLNRVYRYYVNNLFRAEEHDSKRICAICEKL